MAAFVISETEIAPNNCIWQKIPPNTFLGFQSAKPVALHPQGTPWQQVFILFNLLDNHFKHAFTTECRGLKISGVLYQHHNARSQLVCATAKTENFRFECLMPST